MLGAQYFAKMAAEAGCIGQVMLSSGGNMPPTFGGARWRRRPPPTTPSAFLLPALWLAGSGAPRLGTNPVAWAAPAGSETPLMLDMATTQVAGNKYVQQPSLSQISFAALPARQSQWSCCAG